MSRVAQLRADHVVGCFWRKLGLTAVAQGLSTVAVMYVDIECG